MPADETKPAKLDTQMHFTQELLSIRPCQSGFGTVMVNITINRDSVSLQD